MDRLQRGAREANEESMLSAAPSLAAPGDNEGSHPLQQRLDALVVAIADAGYSWTPAMRAAYEGILKAFRRS